ncbi:MAG: hypothetical protein CMH52_10765 [Myxococcales bacterium]|nr:hypothetical protein [Myxococcales bacterium]
MRIYFVSVIVCVLSTASHAQDRPLMDAGEPFGMLPLVDEVVVGQNEDAHGFVESEPGISEVQDILGASTRVIPNVGGARFIGYRMGAGMGLQSGKAYVLVVDYPEDGPRTNYIINRGGEYARGFSTGIAVGDSLQNYTQNNPESLDYPLSGGVESSKTLFFLHENFASQVLNLQGPMARPETPADGFMVYVMQQGAWFNGSADVRQAPLSLGAAVSRIRLFEVPDLDTLAAPIIYPPDGLPRRHLFWREEMSDGAVSKRNNSQSAVDNIVDYFQYKAQMMKFLGMNTFSKDLLEFGANQGWDSNLHGGNSWVHQSEYPQLWSDILEMLGDYGFYVLPMYEYCGSKGDNGLGYQTQAQPLRRDRYVFGEEGSCRGYTHIWWSERCNVDIANPAALDDFRKMIDATITRHRDKVPFVGAWMRTRVADIPISFSDYSLNAFSTETAQAAPVTRPMLRDDDTLLATYKAWWLDQRREFMAGVRDTLHEALGDESVLLFTAYHEEPGPGVTGGIISDDLEGLQSRGLDARSWDEVALDGGYLDALLAEAGNWHDNGCMDPEKTLFEWENANPVPDPQNAKAMDGFLFTYPFNRLYSTSSTTGFDAFRGPAGLAIIKHYPLNEHTTEVRVMGERQSPLGYFVSDMDRNGPYSMLAEARALAHGDPRYIGYLSSQNYTRGFPEYVRRFNRAFLALPAVPSVIWPQASDDDNVVVRAYETEAHGTYLAVVNTGLNAVTDMTITLPELGQVRDAVSQDELSDGQATFSLTLYPGEVRALVFTASAPSPGTDMGVAPVGADGGMGSGVDPIETDAGTLMEQNDGPGETSSSSSGGCESVGSTTAPLMMFLLLLGFIRRYRSPNSRAMQSRRLW